MNISEETTGISSNSFTVPPVYQTLNDNTTTQGIHRILQQEGIMTENSGRR